MGETARPVKGLSETRPTQIVQGVVWVTVPVVGSREDGGGEEGRDDEEVEGQEVAPRGPDLHGGRGRPETVVEARDVEYVGPLLVGTGGPQTPVLGVVEGGVHHPRVGRQGRPKGDVEVRLTVDTLDRDVARGQFDGVGPRPPTLVEVVHGAPEGVPGPEGLADVDGRPTVDEEETEVQGLRRPLEVTSVQVVEVVRVEEVADLEEVRSDTVVDTVQTETASPLTVGPSVETERPHVEEVVLDVVREVR